MFCITRNLVRWGLITGLAVGGATLLIGPHRVASGLGHLRVKAQSVVDGALDTPTALRHQIQVLAQEYPDRIATVESEIAEVDYQIGEYVEDTQVAQRVINMTHEDRSELRTLIASAESVHDRPVFVRFDGIRFDVDQAKNESRRISQIHVSYQDRMATNRQQLEVLKQQKTRLVDVLNRLTDEFASFEVQTWQLDRQIDAIERNDRLIEMTEQLQATLATYDKWGRVGNLRQLESKLRDLRKIQEMQMARLQQAGVRDNYEGQARYEMDLEAQDAASDTIEDYFQDLDKTDEGSQGTKDLAWLGPIVIEH